MHLFFYLLNFELNIKRGNLKNRTESLILRDTVDISFFVETARILLLMIWLSLDLNNVTFVAEKDIKRNMIRTIYNNLLLV